VTLRGAYWMESGLRDEMQIWHYSIECTRLYIWENYVPWNRRNR